MNNFFWALVIVMGTVIIAVGGYALFIAGIPYVLGSGEQPGYISAVEKNGFIWKTGTAFIKPELESTQEDAYCVADDEVYEQLNAAAISKQRVNVKHVNHLSFGVQCNAEGSMITSVEVIQ